MKKIACLFAIALPLLSSAQSHSLEKRWETDTVVAIPESVIPDAKHTLLYVSLIDGGGWDADGKGGVGKLSLDGKHYNGNWISGLKSTKDGLLILARKSVLLADANKQLKTITTLPNGGDGVEEAGNGDLIVSEWLGIVYYVYADGRKEVLLDTHEQKKNTADIHYDIATHTLYIPGFNAKTVSAWRLKSAAATSSATPNSGATTSTGSNSLLWNNQSLASWQQKAQSGDPRARQLLTRLRTQADRLLTGTPTSVMDKSIAPPSGNKHDYMSQAPYYWYDSSKSNGLPYIRRDGERNPEIYTITDHHNLGEIGGNVQTLALAWRLTADTRYSEKAAQLLRHWFFDEATRMNPNLDFGQAIPGINTGRGTGIIETIPLIFIANAALVLEGSPSWTSADAAALRSWYRQYLDWMLNSPNGKDEHKAANNHGSWYLAQVTSFALYIGDTAKARSLALEGKEKIDHQVEADGKMPLELARTNGLGYSTYNLQALFTLARLATLTGTDLWNYNNPQKAGLRVAFNWLLPFALSQKKWEYQQISAYNKDELYALLLQAAPVYSDEQYLTDARLIHNNNDGNPVTEITLHR